MGKAEETKRNKWRQEKENEGIRERRRREVERGKEETRMEGWRRVNGMTKRRQRERG